MIWYDFWKAVIAVFSISTVILIFVILFGTERIE